MLTNIRPLLLPVGVIALALTIFNLRVSSEMADFEVFRQAGRRALAAQPLYQASDGHFAFKYLPAFALAMAPMAIVGDDAAKVTWFALSCALLVMMLRWSAAGLPARRWSARSLIIVAFVLLAKFYAHELTLGQSNLILGVLLLAALGAVQIDAPRVAAVCVALAVFIKPYALIALPWLVVSHGIGAGVVGGLTVFAGLLIPALVYGWAGNLHQLAGWWTMVSSSTAPNLIGADNISLAAMWAKWLGAGPLAALLAVASVLLLLAVAAAIWMQRRGLDEPDYLEFSFLLLLIPLISPQGWDYVLLLATPAVMLVADRWRELSTGWRWWSGAALAIMGLSFFDVMGRAAYTQFMTWSVVSLCAIVIAATLAQIRVRRLA